MIMMCNSTKTNNMLTKPYSPSIVETKSQLGIKPFKHVQVKRINQTKPILLTRVRRRNLKTLGQHFCVLF